MQEEVIYLRSANLALNVCFAKGKGLRLEARSRKCSTFGRALDATEIDAETIEFQTCETVQLLSDDL